MLRMSTLFLRTLREDPADAEVPSHRLLVRAGYIRRTASGIYSWLPLGKIVLDRVTQVVREEMDRIGAQEILCPALLPREPYEETGRWEEYGPELFRLRDRRHGDYLLGPTHEEIFTLLVKGEYSSYKDLPLTLYQIQNKYRDEMRPRSGVIRGREFLMKDSYSFDLDAEGLQRSYELHRDAYRRVMDRLGVDYRIVTAVSGAMGGSVSEEFLAPSPVGEDTFVTCTSCDYAANTEAARAAAPEEAGSPAIPEPDHPEMSEVHTPEASSIESVVDFLGGDLQPSDLLKTMVFRVDGSYAVVCVPGDRDVDEERLAAALAPAEVVLVDDEDFAARPDLVRGFAGPQGMAERGVRILADVRVRPGSAWVTGANRPDHHVRYVVSGRDFQVDAYVDVATVAAGDPCPRCGSPLEIDRAIEVGHIFQLGRKYADALDLTVLDASGRRTTVTMGSYGIGVSRLVAAIAEQTHDEAGLCWPTGVAPADVHIVPVGKGGQREAAESLAEDLQAQGLRVLLDDRGASAGVAFADAELLGVPTVVVAGRAVAEGNVEVRRRATGERELVPLAEVAAAARS